MSKAGVISSMGILTFYIALYVCNRLTQSCRQIDILGFFFVMIFLVPNTRLLKDVWGSNYYGDA